MLISVKSSSDLETTRDETKLGFLEIALRKSKEAQYFVNLSDSLKAEISHHKNPESLLGCRNLFGPLCIAAGISTKSRIYLTDADLRELVQKFFSEFIYPLGEKYHDDLVSRYLLFLGDALGGRMRNIVGSLASEKLTEKIVSSLKLSCVNFQFLERTSKKWISGEKYSIDSLSNIKGFRWQNSKGNRTLLYDTTVPVVKKNVDIVLLNTDCPSTTTEELKSKLLDVKNYELLGELKGGIDPAGADEHWKTAGTALGRIRSAFEMEKCPVKTLFIGAAIEKSMAEEMYQQTADDILTMCANLTKPNQLAEVSSWITRV